MGFCGRVIWTQSCSDSRFETETVREQHMGGWLDTDKGMVCILGVRPRKTAQNCAKSFSVPKLVMAQISHRFSGSPALLRLPSTSTLVPLLWASADLTSCPIFSELLGPHFLSIGLQLALLLISHVHSPFFSAPHTGGTQALLFTPLVLACPSSTHLLRASLFSYEQ